MLYFVIIAYLSILKVVSGIKETTVDLIESQGYQAETHFVSTSDGYILTLHRIPHPGAPIGPFTFQTG